jgi:hypothetical protein
MYRGHKDYAGEVDHAALVKRLESEFDGYVLHTSSVALPEVLPLLTPPFRVMAWVKPFAAFKRNVPVAYAWEPVIVRALRKPKVAGASQVMRDWLAENITMKRGLTGAKPRKVCWWLFEVAGAESDDEFHDLFPGTGAVAAAWRAWTGTYALENYTAGDLWGAV